jgi:hypothetical protein
VEPVRLVEPVVEEAKVNKQMLADANKLMADARIKAVASLAGHGACASSPSVLMGNILFREVGTTW